MTDEAALRAVKTVHTVVWVFFVGCIIGAPLAARAGRFTVAFTLVGIVAIEALVLLLNRWTCPLTGVAARYTTDREPNFDIYLPRWLAQHNKTLFTPLYVLGALYTAVAWWHQG